MTHFISKTLQPLALAFCLAASAIPASAEQGISMTCLINSEAIDLRGSVISNYDPVTNAVHKQARLFLSEDNYNHILARYISLGSPSAEYEDYTEGTFSMGNEPVDIWVQHAPSLTAYRVLFDFDEFLSIFSQLDVENTDDYIGVTPNGWVCENNIWHSYDH
jgi:hypothetical protein